MTDDKVYDVIIIGGGPAGLTAAIYTSRARLKTLVVESYLEVSQVSLTDRIENYPGFPDGVTGANLLEKMKKHAEKFGTQFTVGNTNGINESKLDNYPAWEVVLDSGTYKSLSVIIATGAKASKLGVPREKELTGKGVSYCGVCDAPFFKEKDVVVVGGGDTAVEEALYISKFAKNIKLVHRRDRLRATKILQERAFANDKIDFVWDSVVTEILGDGKVTGVKVKNLKTAKEDEIQCDGIFIYIGLVPNTNFVERLVDMDDRKYIIADSSMKTSKPGIFACGDCIKKDLRQIVTATGDGANAGYSAQLYVEKLKGTAYE